MGPEPLPGAPGAVPADPGMDSEGWFAVNGWKYLVKWHHSGSYQLYPGKVPRGVCALWLAGAGWLMRPSGMCAGPSRPVPAARSPGRRPGLGCKHCPCLVRGCGLGEIVWRDNVGAA